MKSQESGSASERLALVELGLMSESLGQTNGRIGDAAKRLGYHDRFTFRRRLKAIARDHPDLLERFPGLQRILSNPTV
jgi:hypothetical protein